MVQFVLTSIIAFVSTNVDDTFLLMLFFGDKKFKTAQIVAGQLLGIGVLIVASLLLSFVGLVIAKSYVGILGLIPIYLGVRGILRLLNKTDNSDDEIVDTVGRRNNIIVVAGITIANGGDNIGVYTPLFAAITWSQKITMISVFIVMTVVLCVLAKYLTHHPLVAKLIARYGHIITPFVLILLGLYIMYESGTLALIM